VATACLAVTGKLTPTPLSMAAQETTTMVQSSDAVKKPQRELKHLPLISGDTDRRRNNGAATVGTDLAVCMAKDAACAGEADLHAHAEAEHAAAAGGNGRWEQLEEAHRVPLPAARGSSRAYAARCTSVPGRAWMRTQRRGCSGGGGECAEAEVVAPPKVHGWAFSIAPAPSRMDGW
jgi:hypothetical protein